MTKAIMTNKTALLTPLSLVTAATLAAILTPASAMALTFNWSFVAGTGSSGQVGQTISGTISGLVEHLFPNPVILWA